MKLRASLWGLPRLGGALSGIAGEAAISEAIRETAKDIRERAAANLAEGAALDASSSALARSLTLSQADNGSATVATPLDHGWRREFGSLRRAARPWLAPAAETARPGLVVRLRERLNAALAAALRR